MEGYRKVIQKNSKGEILLAMTTSSMVSEESDRRFVDNIEKEVINKIATEETAIDELIFNHQSLAALASKELELLGLVDEIPEGFFEWGDMISRLSVLEPFKDEIIAGIGASPEVISRESGYKYLIEVNDSDPNDPFLYLVKADDYALQPDNYMIGDEWIVPANALDIKVDINLEKISFSGNQPVVQSFLDGENKSSITDEQLDNILNGVEEKFKGESGSIPQLFVQFGMEETEELIQKARRFEFEIESSEGTKVQMYMDGDVVHPVRTSTKSYQKATFTHLTWQTYVDEHFIKSIQNNGGGYALTVYGSVGAEISAVRPKAMAHVENPYKGKTLVAIRNQQGEFNISDWKVKE